MLQLNIYKNWLQGSVYFWLDTDWAHSFKNTAHVDMAIQKQ